jgi:hypothetical protein
MDIIYSNDKLFSSSVVACMGNKKHAPDQESAGWSSPAVNRVKTITIRVSTKESGNEESYNSLKNMVPGAGLENAAAMLTKGQRAENDETFLSFQSPMRRV